jgi:prolyl-tRNA synthetase
MFESLFWLRNMKQSHLLTKTKRFLSQQEPSINARLLEQAGYISKLMAGVYSYLPLGLKALNNVERIVREEMNALGAQEILMPALQPKEIWETTERWNTVDVLYKLTARDKEIALGPTHEEVVTPLVQQYVQSYKDLPQAVYQIQTKFRNEARPKSGLLRGREFRMKDLYSFHTAEKELDAYYDKVKESYIKIFDRCGLGAITYFTYASGGIFSKYSHEFQTVTPYGEDIIYICEPCKIAINKEIIEDLKGCPECETKELIERKAIEVGNIFKLKDRFSIPFGFNYTDKEGKQHPVIMGSYGIGTSRLVGAIVEVMHDDKGIIWPEQIAPFTVHLLSLVKEQQDKEKVEAFYYLLEGEGISVLYDDRDAQAGEKFADADLLGMPWRIVVSSKTLAQNGAELKARTQKEAQLLPFDKVIELLRDLTLAK